jgi:hypothetical protein
VMMYRVGFCRGIEAMVSSFAAEMVRAFDRAHALI